MFFSWRSLDIVTMCFFETPFFLHYQQEEIKKQTSLKATESREPGSPMLQAQTVTGFSRRSSFGQMSSFAASNPVFQSTGFSAPATTLNQPSSLFSTSNSTNQFNLFGQSNVSGMTGNVFGNTLRASNQQTGMTSRSLTNQSTTMSVTNFSQSAASNSGFFGVETESKPGVFGSVPSPAVTVAFPSESQAQKDIGTNPSNHTSGSSMVGVSSSFFLSSEKEGSYYFKFQNWHVA